jgi:hypothetical protein
MHDLYIFSAWLYCLKLKGIIRPKIMFMNSQNSCEELKISKYYIDYFEFLAPTNPIYCNEK